MAKEEKPKSPVESKVSPVEVRAPQPEPEAKYSRSELMQAAVSFSVKPEVMAGALRLAGKDEMTKIEAQAAIKKFLERKVN